MKHRNLLGEKFGRWTVIEDNGKRKNRHILVTCQCQCGTILDIVKSNFIYGTNSEKCFKCSRKIHRMFTYIPNRLLFKSENE